MSLRFDDPITYQIEKNFETASKTAYDAEKFQDEHTNTGDCVFTQRWPTVAVLLTREKLAFPEDNNLHSESRGFGKK